MSTRACPRLVLVLTSLLALAASTLWAPRARAHTPPPIFMSISIDAEDVVWETTLAAGIFEEWLGIDASTLAGEGHEITPLERERMEQFFSTYAQVHVDRMRVKGTLTVLESTSYIDHDTNWEYVKFSMTWQTMGPPRQVGFAWTRYDAGLRGDLDWIESEIDAFQQTSYYVFRAKEPEIVWHAPRAQRTRLTPALPTVAPAPLLRLPLVSLALLLGLAILATWMHVAGVTRPVRWVGVGVVSALVLAFSGVAHTDLDLPFGARFDRPSDDEALYAFESLLKNVYRAFDYDGEDAIYDTLAQSVEGDLLEEIYLEVYGGLVLQEEGGAVCDVQQVEILESSVIWPDDENARYYRVRAKWQVHGKVGHWGHTHIRVNEYTAVFSIALRGANWKIAALRIVSKDRVLDEEREGDGR